MSIDYYKGSGGDQARSYGNNISNFRDAFFLELVERYKSRTLILDAGSGTADLPILMAQRNTNLFFICTDLEQENLTNAQKAVKKAGLQNRFEFINCPADELQIEDFSVDVAIACSVFPYCKNIVEAVRQFIFKVKVGGAARFDLSTIPPGDWSSSLQDIPWILDYNQVNQEELNKIEELGKVSCKVQNEGIILYELIRSPLLGE